jgi:hypothetical protein
MQQLTAQQIAQQQYIASIIATLLRNVSVTFAQVFYTTQVQCAAAHKHNVVLKHTTANVQLFSNVQAAVYANAVQRSAAQHSTNSATAVANFAAQQNYFAHTNCYSIVQHKQTNALYLYCIYNSARSTYTVNAAAATKQQVAQLLTASAAAKLLQANSTQYNATHNITHNVVVRTIALHNIASITAQQQQVQFS